MILSRPYRIFVSTIIFQLLAAIYLIISDALNMVIILSLLMTLPVAWGMLMFYRELDPESNKKYKLTDNQRLLEIIRITFYGIFISILGVYLGGFGILSFLMFSVYAVIKLRGMDTAKFDFPEVILRNVVQRVLTLPVFVAIFILLLFQLPVLDLFNVGLFLLFVTSFAIISMCVIYLWGIRELQEMVEKLQKHPPASCH